MKILRYHHGGNTTVIAGGFCANGCQIFDHSNAEAVFENFKVSEQHRADVMEHLAASENDGERELIFALTFDYRFFRMIPAEKRTMLMCFAVVEQVGCNLRWVPEAYKTAELCMKAVQNDGSAVQYVPAKHLTPELCAAAVMESGSALRFVPPELRTASMYVGAVVDSTNNLSYVAEDLKTDEFWHEVCTKAPWAFKHAPDHVKTEQLLLDMVKASDTALVWLAQWAPELQTAAIADAAIENGALLRYVRKDLRTEELCLKAVKLNSENICAVPYAVCTPEMEEMAKAMFVELRQTAPEQAELVLKQVHHDAQ